MRNTPQFACAALGMMLMATTQLAPDVFAQSPIKESDSCGFVQDASGAPIAEASIKAMSGDKTIATAITLSDGSFHLSESKNSRVDLEVSAQGFAAARGSIDRMHAEDSRKCKHPVYAVLATGQGHSFITAKKSELPKRK